MENASRPFQFSLLNVLKVVTAAGISLAFTRPVFQSESVFDGSLIFTNLLSATLAIFFVNWRNGRQLGKVLLWIFVQGVFLGFGGPRIKTNMHSVDYSPEIVMALAIAVFVPLVWWCVFASWPRK